MKKIVQDLLDKAGITINGPKPYDIQVHDQRFFKSILLNPSLGAGESYIHGWWDCQQLDELFFRITRDSKADIIYRNWKMYLIRLANAIFNQQTKKKSQTVIRKHYNLDNELYSYMLGKSMAYTCAYWCNTDDLDQAQLQKFDLICRKLDLQPGDKVLELGCGWGSFAKFAAQQYQCEVTAINISSEQIRYAKESTENLPIKFLLSDYRDIPSYNPSHIKFDKIISIGLCEHVGYKNYRQLMEVARKNLKDDGLFLLHTIGRNTSINYVDPWINKYIFPNGMLPSISQLSASMETLFVMEDLHNFGADYDKTLIAWSKNFQEHWPKLAIRYDENFYRMWLYYLHSCAGAFRAREMQLWQFVLSPKGKLNGYRSIR